MVGVNVGIRENIVCTVGGVVAVPHEFQLGVFRAAVVQESAESEGSVNSEPVNRIRSDGAAQTVDGIRGAGLIANERSKFKAALSIGGNRCEQEGHRYREPRQTDLH